MSTRLSEKVHALLIEEGLNPDPMPETTIHTPNDNEPNGVHSEENVTMLKLPVQGKQGEWVCIVRVFEQTERLLVYSLLPRDVPKSEREKVALMLTQINYGLVLGNFEMDLGDGEVRYKTSMDVEGIEPSRLMLRNLLFGNFFSMDLYFKALMNALDSDRDVSSLVYEAEHPDSIGHFDLVDDVVH